MFLKFVIVIVIYYLVMSLITFVTYALDKSAAKKGRWRTKESTLHILATIGGWPGAHFAQKWLRHKSSKRAFKRMYWLTIVANVCLLFGVIYVSIH